MKVIFKQFTESQMQDVQQVVNGRVFDDALDILMAIWEMDMPAVMTYLDEETVAITMMIED